MLLPQCGGSADREKENKDTLIKQLLVKRGLSYCLPLKWGLRQRTYWW